MVTKLNLQLLIFFFMVLSGCKSKRDEFKFVKSYGGEIGEIMVMYINENPTDYKKFTDQLKIIFKGRLKKAYVGMSDSVALVRYAPAIFNLYNKMPVTPGMINQLIQGDYKVLSDTLNKNSLEFLLKTLLEKEINADNLLGIDYQVFIIPAEYIPGTTQKHIWIQDYFLSMQNNKNEWIIYADTTIDITRFTVSYLDKHLPNEKYKGIRYSELTEMEGGNMVIGDSFIITNHDLRIANLCKNKNLSINQVDKRLKCELQTDNLIWADSSYANFKIPAELRGFHTDMYISLGPETVDSQYIFVAELDTLYHNNFDSIYPRRSAMRDRWETVDEFLDRVATNVLPIAKGKKPFAIKRLPCILTFIGSQITMSSKFSKLGHDTWRLRTFNNSIAEEQNTERIIYLPTYNGSGNGDSAIVNYKQFHADAENELKKYYTKVVWINAPDAFEKFSILKNGSLNCVTKILYRQN